MEREEPEFRSTRRYPKQDCENPGCIKTGVFEPHDKRQKFCCTACRIAFHNDKRSMEESTIYSDYKRLKAIDKKLERMYIKYADKNGACLVRKEIFHYESIDVMLLLRELQNMSSGQTVKGYFRYGIELSAEDNNFYFIHKLKRS